MRIVHVSDSYLPLLGGIETQVARLARRQAEAGHEVEVVTTTPAAKGEHGIATATDEHGVVVHRVAARVPGGYPVHPRSTRHVLARLRELEAGGRRPGVVHLHMGVLAPTVELALRPVARAGFPLLLTVHSVWGGWERAFAGLDRVTGWSAWPVQWSAVSELTAAPLRRVVGRRLGPEAAAARVSVLGNGIDVESWRLPRVERGDRAEGREVHVVSATRFAPRKRVLPMLEAVATAVDRAPGRIVATIGGDGPQLAEARRWVRERGLADTVRLVGRLSPTELKRLYVRADVFVAPAVQDAFGIAALEAQAAGLAVVSRSQSGVAERLVDGRDALLVDDDAAMADALVRLADDPALLDAIVAHNRSAELATSWPRVLADVEAAYRRSAALAR
ncbi:glycosyltransferase family 4 protein [Isoptericola sp. 4D.3]|uniref:Glycosyltransferase family 4 protein n=1 Tax=Isoptericola peretonis TaxID=2918523 RepID=A0ABT0IZ15_9MICO|nr:glycosyltransferase family 4 protein [Isoptericola sp. 4D.3]